MNQNETVPIVIKAINGVSALKTRQRAMVKEHTERIKLLDGIVTEICHASRTGQTDFLDAVESRLSPELKNLLENPVRGL